MKQLLVLLTLISSLAFAQSDSEPLLKVDLIPETTTIAAGKPFTVALKLKHIEHGHSYWKNPGGPGMAAKVKWTLPEGFTASDPQWPAPHIGKTGDILNYVFEGEVYPLVTITPPAQLKTGDKITLKTSVFALVCLEVCPPPRNYPAEATVTVADAPGAPEAATQDLFAKARAAIPGEPKNWTFTAEQKGTDYAILLKPGAGANAKLTKAYFYSAAYPDQDIDSQKPQELKKEGDQWRLTLPPTADNPPKEALVGLLTSQTGWLFVDGNNNVHAFEVNLPLNAASASASTPAPADPDKGGTPAPSGDATGGRGTFTLLLFAFIGGLILNVMPCVFPVLGIKIMGFVQQAGEDRRKIFLHGLAYTLGVLVCFWALALLVITLGQGWGFQLQSPHVNLFLGYFFIGFGMNMAGVFEIGTSAVGVGQGLQSKSGLKGSFFSGLLATVVATPCSAPFLAPALTYALSLPKALALGMFTIIGLGLSFPYLLLSFVPGLVKILPRPGAWMESFKQGMSFLLFGTGGYMLWNFDGMVDERNFLFAIIGAVLVAMACWIYGRWFLPHKSVKARAWGLTLAVLFLAGGFFAGWPRLHEKWTPWSPELVKELRDSGTPVYIDFTARWCATCQTNKRVYEDESLKKLIKDKKIKLVKADWTNYDERITNTLRDQYGKSAIPVNVYYAPGAKDPVILPEFLTVDNVSSALK